MMWNKETAASMSDRPLIAEEKGTRKESMDCKSVVL